MTPSGERAQTAAGKSVTLSPMFRSRVRQTFERLPTTMRGSFLERLTDMEERSSTAHEEMASLLMEGFSRTRNLDAFSLLYELTHPQILLVILKRTRFSHPSIDPRDVLQDVFLSIYRYPHRFRNEKSASFRNWSFSIVRNTLLKHVRSVQRSEVELDPISEVVEDHNSRAPLSVLEDDEETLRASQTFALCLLAYRRAFHDGLKEREKRALRLIEVKGLKYRRAAELMEVRLENLKMIVCRARKKLLRAMQELLERQQP